MATVTAGVRDYLNGLGVDNTRIGWNARDKYVTLDGQYFMSPASVTNGVSYANPNDIQSAYQRLMSNNVGAVVANPYAGRTQEAVAAVAAAPAVTVPTWDQTYEAPVYSPLYTGKVQGLLTDAENAKFSFDPKTDRSAQIYRDMYEREGQAAMDQVAAATAANTGGVLSTYGAAAANQARQAYAKKAADIIPQLEQQAYARFSDQQNRSMSLAQIYQELENANRSNFESDRDFGYGVYSDDYSRWADQRDFGFTANQETYNRSLNLAQLYADLDSEYYNRDLTERDRMYNQTRDAEDDRRYNQEWAYQLAQDAKKTYSGSGSGSRTKTIGSLPGTLEQQAYYDRAVAYLRKTFGDDAEAMSAYIAKTAAKDDSYQRLMGDELFDYFYTQARSGDLVQTQEIDEYEPVFSISQLETAIKNGNITGQVKRDYEYYYGEPYQEKTTPTVDANGNRILTEEEMNSDEALRPVIEMAEKQKDPEAWLYQEYKNGNITSTQYNKALSLMKYYISSKNDKKGSTTSKESVSDLYIDE